VASSEELHKRRHAAAVARGVSSVVTSYVDSAGGGGLRDVDGRDWIDFASGIAVTSVGNAAPRVVAAVRDQVERFTHTCFMVAPYESYIAVCEQLAALTPGTFDKRAALFNSGAEAVENAVKIARHATGRPAVVVFDHAYHGRTNLTMALTAKVMPYKHRFGPFAPEIYRAPLSYPLRDGGLAGPDAARRAIDVIDKQVGGDNVAAVLIEPIQGEGGFVVPAPGFLPALAAWARGAGALFVADEIQTGFCRTGAWFACEHEDVEPDLVTTAKGMAGGLPLAGVVGPGRGDGRGARRRAGRYVRRESGRLRRVAGGHRDDAGAGPRRGGPADRGGDEAPARGARVVDPGIGDVRGRGAMLAIELVRPGTIEPDAARTASVAKACHAAGLLVLTCGTYSNVLRFLPPLVISGDELSRGLEILSGSLRANVPG
jgi:4-aminobutyrate aminotransferase/(S)-3-amino-2-methylpropionate transaminase